MQRNQDGLVPIGEVVGDLDGPVKEIRDATPQSLHHFTLADQVDRLVAASEADPDLGFMARLLALCSLPRTNPGNRIQYRRVNGPYTLYMTAGGGNKLPYGNLPRLILAVMEAALAHVIKDKAEAAYARSDLFGHRRKLMDDWATYVGRSERPPL